MTGALDYETLVDDISQTNQETGETVAFSKGDRIALSDIAADHLLQEGKVKYVGTKPRRRRKAQAQG